MNIIKVLRSELNYTQSELAHQTGLSLRTIQRLEAGDKAPKGYALTALALTFQMESSVLREKFSSVNENNVSDKMSIKLINLSVLSMIGLPFGNVIVPFVLWYKNRSSNLVDEVGRKIINTQVIWTVGLAFSLCITPLIAPSRPLILVVLFLAYVFNVLIVCRTAYLIGRDDLDRFNPPISFI